MRHARRQLHCERQRFIVCDDDSLAGRTTACAAASAHTRSLRCHHAAMPKVCAMACGLRWDHDLHKAHRRRPHDRTVSLMGGMYSW